jgi:hypothetical protein
MTTLEAGLIPVLHSTPENFRLIIERRCAYASAAERLHGDLSRYFIPGVVDGVVMRTEPMAHLTLPSGRLVVCDPFTVGEEFTRPFARQVAPGAYPVVAAIASLGEWGERVAFVNVKFADVQPVTWQRAATSVDDGTISAAFGVDAGLGCVVDAVTAAAFGRVQAEFAAAHPDGDFYAEVLTAGKDEEPNWIDYRPDPASEANAVIFASGLGDGLYMSHWGLNEAGEPVCLVTDLQLFDADGSIMRA